MVLRNVVALGLSLCAAVPAAGDSVDDYVRSAMAKSRIPGVSIAIVRDGAPPRVQGYGYANVELDALATADTIYQSGSTAKQFTAAIARYVDDDLTVVVLTNLASAEPETMAHVIAGLADPSLRLPDPAATLDDPDPPRESMLRGLLEAWAESRVVPAMARGLAETASGSSREAHDRLRTGKHAAALTAFRFLGEDDLADRPLRRRGESVLRIAHYALDTKDARYAYRFYLTGDGRVADFAAEAR